ncbi:serine/threonine protein kinase with PASTA sensor(S) [Clostridium sp. CAG:798]|jgi:serine/threonine protein kinase|nr:serine/threonine protein kinase with PASTA sensor(S) [Clostridium sp. CAG:798]
MSLEGKIIGNRYEVLEKIGIGGMATVYKAKDNILKRNVAVKVLRDEFTTDEEFIKRFNTEAQAAASLTHPNIVSIYDVGHEDNLYFIVMELIQGKTLKQIITEDGVLPWKWSINIAIQIASALEIAHKNNIVHRDIKPHNIIITEDGVAKVTDFGIAKAVSNSTITAFGTTIGSVHYFSPEHARGGYTDAKSDIYSLGVVMYEMMTGRVPFDADTPVSIALKHMQEKPVEPIKLNPSIPYAVNKIIMKAMQKEVALRYSSATEMLKDLNAALKNPDGNTVMPDQNIENSYTQRIPTIQGGEKMNQKERKVNAFFKKHKKAIMIAIIVLIVILIPVIGFYGTQAILNVGRAKDVKLPNLVGKTIEEAEQELNKSKLKIEKKEEFNSEIEAGKIISQNPPFIENYTVKENSTVEVVVSKGTEMTKVPKIIGMEYEEAEEEIKKYNLQAEKIDKVSKTVEKGIVIEQEPAENTEIKAGEKVKIYVSCGNGLKQIVTQYVIGKTEKDAKELLTKDGLEVEVVNEEDTTKENGIVLKQSIEAGKTVDEGTKIIITVNKIAEIKTGKIDINLKSITGGIKLDAEGNEINPEATVTVKVTSAGKEETVYNEKHRKDTSTIIFDVKGVGTITIKVYVDDVLKRQTQMNLNSSDTFWRAE